MKEDRNLLVAAHLSQLLDLFTGIGGFIVPLVLWLTQRDKIYAMDAHGKAILNFQISLFIYCLICIPLILFFGLGLLGILVLGLFSLLFPIVNAVRASQGEPPYYPINLPIIS
ncbi:DUF4870 domain-containing protein [Croceiramulus getboli]|nr:DUF4870 domain-containing protein [Flavobacteriaceae bacterium YJPT1-3]